MLTDPKRRRAIARIAAWVVAVGLVVLVIVVPVVGIILFLVLCAAMFIGTSLVHLPTVGTKQFPILRIRGRRRSNIWRLAFLGEHLTLSSGLGVLLVAAGAVVLAVS